MKFIEVIVDGEIIEEYDINFLGLLEALFREQLIKGRVFIHVSAESGINRYHFFVDYIEDAKKISEILQKLFKELKSKIFIQYVFFELPQFLRLI